MTYIAQIQHLRDRIRTTARQVDAYTKEGKHAQAHQLRAVMLALREEWRMCCHADLTLQATDLRAYAKERHAEIGAEKYHTDMETYRAYVEYLLEARWTLYSLPSFTEWNATRPPIPDWREGIIEYERETS